MATESVTTKFPHAVEVPLWDSFRLEFGMRDDELEPSTFEGIANDLQEASTELVGLIRRTPEDASEKVMMAIEFCMRWSEAFRDVANQQAQRGK